MQAIILIVLLSFFIGLTSSAQNKVADDYTGTEYLQLKSELCRGWNTWNTNSVLSHVLLPEAISIDFYLKDKSTGKILREALMGRRGKEAESILPLAHTNDGSYTELEIKWNGIELKIQSSAVGKNICFLFTPLSENVNGEILVSPHEIWWDRDGKADIGDGQLTFELPSGKIVLYVKSKTEIKEDTLFKSLVFPAKSEIVLSTEADLTVSDVKKKISSAKANHEENKNKYGEDKELYHAMQNALAWNIIYEPDEQRELTTVSRLWNTYRGGYVIFCWDNYFAAYMHSLDNKHLAYSNAIEMTNAITPSGFVPNLSASKGIKTSDRSQPPVGSFVVREIYRKYKEKWFLHEVFQKLLTWNRWWAENRDTDGFLCWGSSPFEPYLRNLDKHANTRFGAALESGLDNSPMYDDIPFDTISNQLKLADVGLMSLYVMDCEALADIAGEIGKDEIKKELLERADKYRKNLNKLWDEKTGIYLNKRLDTNEFSYKLSPTNFYPLLANAPTQKQAARMINEHFYNPAEFWGEYMLPSIAFNDSGYDGSDYWRGRVWGPMNFLVYLGFGNCQLENARKDLVTKSKELFLKQWLENGYICENYNSQTGECDDVSRCELFYHWGGLLGFISLIEEGFVKSPNEALKEQH
jgi:putative isomerase